MYINELRHNVWLLPLRKLSSYEQYLRCWWEEDVVRSVHLIASTTTTGEAHSNKQPHNEPTYNHDKLLYGPYSFYYTKMALLTWFNVRPGQQQEQKLQNTLLHIYAGFNGWNVFPSLYRKHITTTTYVPFITFSNLFHVCFFGLL